MINVQTGGKGPPLQFHFFGTAFLVTSDGRLLTNRHVAEPWSSDEDLKELLGRGADAFALSYMAYFPDSRHRGPSQPDFGACRFGDPASYRSTAA